MSCKITIEVDGQSEEELAPLISRMASQYAQGPSSHIPLYHENPVDLRAQIELLKNKNVQLQTQLNIQQASASRLPSTLDTSPVLALPPMPDQRSVKNWPPGPINQSPQGKPISVRPDLPTQYQPARREILLRQIKQQALQARQKLWQGTVWLTLGKEWLAVVLILGAGIGLSVRVIPAITPALLGERSSVESEGPGAVTAPTEEPVEDSDTTSETTPETTSGEATPSTAQPPASKAGTRPPPPPAFNQSHTDY